MKTGPADPTPAGLARDGMERAAATLLNPHSAATRNAGLAML